MLQDRRGRGSNADFAQTLAGQIVEIDFENLENLQVELVSRLLPKLLQEELSSGRELCTCRTCTVDVAAVALNLLTPRYVADRLNRLPEADDERRRHEQAAADAVRQAILKVARRPHHD